MNTNHVALNIVTKGLLNISNITKGILFQLVLKKQKKRGGGIGKEFPAYEKKTETYQPPLYYEREPLFKEVNKYNQEDIDSIKVYVDWNKYHSKNEKIEVKMIKKHIEADIMTNTGKKINVNIIKKPE